jgi:hypothetical protein
MSATDIDDAVIAAARAAREAAIQLHRRMIAQRGGEAFK